MITHMNDIEIFRHTPPPVGLLIEPSPEGLAERDALITEAVFIDSVKTPEENERCADVGSAIQTQIKRTEKTGLELRRPYNFEADKIKAVQEAYLNPLRPHLTRLGRLAAVYRTEQEAQAERERRARTAEIVRLQEQARLADEDARKAAEKGDQMAELAADIGRQALSDLTIAAISKPEPEATKTACQAFKARELGWECTDPIALYRARPELCNAPTPKPSAIKAVCCPEMPVPGLRLWWEAIVSFKSR